MENIQLVPPRAGPTVTPNDKCIDIGKGGKIKKQRKQSTEEKRTTKATSPNKRSKSKERNQEEGGEKEDNKSKIKDKEGATRRAPRTAAISIKSDQKEFSYAQALKIAREKIDLSVMGIENPKIRKAANVGIIIEIFGKDSAIKADKLVNKIQEVFKQGNVKAVVKRPTIKGELRIFGFDNSVLMENIRGEISKKGICLEKDIEVGPIRGMTNGLCTVWARCPLAAAIQIASEGKIRIGWTIARVELLKANSMLQMLAIRTCQKHLYCQGRSQQCLF